MSIKPATPSDSPINDGPQKFPKPNTIPNGWDISELTAAYNSPELVEAQQPVEAEMDCSAELTKKYAL